MTIDLIANITHIIEDTEAAIVIANETGGVDKARIDLAYSKLEEAKSNLHLAEYDGSEGFHDPEGTFRILGEAALLGSESKSLALEALREAETGRIEAELQAQVSNMQNIALGGTIGALIVGLLVGILVQRSRK